MMSARLPFAALLVAASVAMLLQSPASVDAAAKVTIGMRGVARSAAGGPISDGSYGIKVSFYEQHTGGQSLYTDVSPAVKVAQGLFVMRIGSFKDLDTSVLLSGKAAWLGISIAGEAELPRQPIEHVAYAVKAHAADTLLCTACVGKKHLAADVLAGVVKESALAKVATSGAWADIQNKPKLIEPFVCPAGHWLTGHTPDGKPACAPIKVTTYNGKDFATSGQSCPKGKVLTGIDAAGKAVCSQDEDTKYGGLHFALSDQNCAPGKLARGVDSNGKLICAADEGKTYSGKDFALSGKSCPPGQFVHGIDANGAPTCVAESGKANWGAEGTASGNTSMGFNGYKELQHITVPSAGKYLVIANYRIRRSGSSHGFVKAKLVYEGKSTEARMICEGFRPANSNFTNYGGSVSWVIQVQGSAKISVQYSSHYNNIYSWVNDTNGVPRPIAIKL